MGSRSGSGATFLSEQLSRTTRGDRRSVAITPFRSPPQSFHRPVTRTFESPRSYHPSYSLLGRAVRAWVGDRMRGEALYIVALTGLTLVVLMSHYLGWALLKPVLTANPSWQAWFWGGQIVSLLALIGVGLVGFRPPVRVECHSDAVTLTQGAQSCTLPYASIDAISRVSAQRHHRHYRRYAATQIFVSAPPDEVILLRTDDGPVIVALPDSEAQDALIDRLETARSPTPKPVVEAQP